MAANAADAGPLGLGAGDAARSRRAFARWCLAAALLTLGLALWLALGVGGPATVQVVSNLAQVVAPLAAAVSCLARSRRSAGRVRRCWALFAASTLSWGLGQCVWTWYESILGREVPFPSLADVGYLGAVPLMAAALFVLPVASQGLANRVRSVLDGLLIGGSMLLVSWSLVLERSVSAGGDSTLALVISLAYPIGDLVVVTVVLFMLGRLRRAGSMPVPLALLGTGLVGWAVADSGFVYGTLTGAYSSGALIDVGWFAGFLLVGLAARKPAPAVAAEGDGDGAQTSRPLGVVLPYVAVSITLVVNVLDRLTGGTGSTFAFWVRTCIIALMVGRQLLTLLENHGLTRHLEARVAARTAELRASEQRFRALVQHSSDVVTVVDPDALVLYQSESVLRVFGYQAEELAGGSLTRLLEVDAASRLHQALHQVSLRPYGTLLLELPVRHRDGHLRHAEMLVTNLLDDPSVGGLVLNTRDVSERKELEDQLVHQAFHDSLTKLANRALFKDRVEQALRRRRDAGTLVGVLFLDLDGFKEVNDSLGHGTGDELLIKVAERLREAVRDEDTVARFGGDEFAVLIEHVAGQDDTEEVARRLVAGLREPFAVEGHQLYVRASIGIAVTGSEAGDVDQLLRNADLAMYQAKTARFGGFARFDPSMHSRLVERLQLENDLRLALEADELELHYQPTIELATGELVGFEALARWRHPVRGLIPPAEFIPLAESTGLIRQLGQWVLVEACRQAVAWDRGVAAGGRPLSMSVNVSGRQFDQSDLPTVVAMALAETGLPAERLCLEMTESVLMNDTEENLALLKRLKALGVHLAIDDFGTGYSSLSYLHRFPVDTLKIDRSFVERLSHASGEAALARTIVQLGQSLGMVTVAEGIEQHGQLVALNHMTCELGQGYYFSRPLPAAEAGRLLAQPPVPAGAEP